jgi:hypothetical protein
MPQEVVTALTDYAIEQGWDLVGPCELHTADDPGFVPGQQCYFNAQVTADGFEVMVGGVASQANALLILREQPSGSYVIVGATPMWTPATGK